MIPKPMTLDFSRSVAHCDCEACGEFKQRLRERTGQIAETMTTAELLKAKIIDEYIGSVEYGIERQIIVHLVECLEVVARQAGYELAKASQN